MSVVLLRTDGSHHIGFGHVMRCIALAEGLREIGFAPLFVVRGYNQVVSDKIRRSGFAVESFPREWTSEEDLEFTIRQVEYHQARYVVTDLNHDRVLEGPESHRRYIERLRATGPFLITIGDFNESLFPADLVINPNYGADVLPPKPSPGTRYLLGTKYFILRREFIVSCERLREIRPKANRVLVTMGGSDLLGLTDKVIRALSKVEMDPPLELCLVAGVEDRKRQESSLAPSGFCRPPVTLVDPDNMGELMFWCDLAITGGGLTKYETAVTGSPSVVISQARHQALIMERFSNAGTAVHLGYGSDVHEDAIAEAVRTLLNDYLRRKEMSLAGKRLMDGGGLERVLQAVQQLVCGRVHRAGPGC
ncbi:MAG: PseG/SpsG family protein [Candidatus Binatia bacterium]